MWRRREVIEIGVAGLARSGGAVLADLDNTLVYSREAERMAWAWWARQHGLDPQPFLRLEGWPGVEKIRKHAPHLDARAEGMRIAEYEITHTIGVWELPGAARLLRCGVPIAIVTSATRDLALARLRAAGLKAPAALVTAESVVSPKPHAEPFVKAAELLGSDPARCVALEDSPAGVRAGKAAGSHVVGVRTTSSADDLIDAGADAVVSNVAGYLKL